MAATIHCISSFGSMRRLPKVAWISILAAGAFALPLSPKVSAQVAQIRHLSVMKSGGSVQIEIQTSRRVLPLTQVITDPDRLIIDFSDAVAGPDLRAVNVATGEVKAVRVGRVTANPPITRIVVDLNSAQAFQVFPSSKSLVIKVGDGTGTAVASVPPLKTQEVVEKSAPESVPAEAASSAPAPTPTIETPAAVASNPEPASAVPTTTPSPAPASTAKTSVAAATPPPPTPPTVAAPVPPVQTAAPVEAMQPAIAAVTPSAPATSISVSVPATTPAMAPAVASAAAPPAMTPAVAPATAPQPAMTPAVAAAPSVPTPSASPAAVHLASAALAPSTSTPPVAVRTLSITPAPAPTPAVTVSRLPVSGGPSVEIQHVSVLKSAGATEIEIATSQRVTPEVQVITGPDRLVLDFPQSLPGARLRAVAVNQGEVKGVRVGLLTAKPPVTRVVLDLKSPQAYQVFPSARSVIVKLPDAAGATARTMPPGNAAPAGSNTPAAQPLAPAPPPKKVEINVQDGRLTLTSNRASLAEVLSELQRQTGASIVVPPGADQEVVAVSLGPASPREVISQLLNGSRYNFIIVGANNDPNKVERLLLTPKSPGGVTAEIQTNQPDFVPVAQVQAPDSSTPPPPPPPPAPPEDAQPQGDSAPPPDTPPQPGDPQPAPN
jgi:hypothetical protein